MYSSNGASSSVLMLASPYTNRTAYSPAHTTTLSAKPAPPALSMSGPASFYGSGGAAAPASFGGYGGCSGYAYGASYPQYAAARLGAPSSEGYLRQQRTIEIIALEEVPAPAPLPARARPARAHRRAPRPSVPASSSAASSSTCTSSGDDDDDDDEEEEEEEGGESYCSSEEDTDPRLLDARERARVEVSFNARMRRIEQWRETYAKAVGAELAPSPSRTNSSKRKGDHTDADMDNRSRTSKRSRNSSSSSTASSTAVSTASARSAHSCSACDACFPDASSLKRHGAAPATNEACRAAVEYGFEGTA